MTMAHRRINYRYLAHLSERLQDLGHDIQEIPIQILEQTWQHIRDYIQTEFELAYCVRCKLPISNEDQGEYHNMCRDHSEQFADVWTDRKLAKLSRVDGRLVGMVHAVRNPKSPESTDVVGSNAELATKIASELAKRTDLKSTLSVQDILERAIRKTN